MAVGVIKRTLQTYDVLERQLAEWSGIESHPNNVVVCSSGTAALHLALEALRLEALRPQFMDIQIPNYTMVACARAAVLAGLRPKFIDCREQDLLIQTNEMCDFRRVMPVHIYGRRCDMEAVHEYSPPLVVEDMAEIHGVKPHSRSDAACWSFYHNKIVAGQEGGAVWFRSTYAAQRARALRSLGMQEPYIYQHLPRGHNYRLSNAHAAFILQSLSAFDTNVLRRREVEGWFDKYLPQEFHAPTGREAVWVYDVRLPRRLAPHALQALVSRLNEEGYLVRPGFVPMLSQDEFRLPWRGVDGGVSVAESMVGRVLYFAVYPWLGERDVRRTAEAFLAAYEEEAPGPEA
jgi:perosamine synthetase